MITVAYLDDSGEQSIGLIGMDPIPSSTFFVFAPIRPGTQFISKGVLEPFEIYFLSESGQLLSGLPIYPPYQTVNAPAQTAIAVEAKLGSAWHMGRAVFREAIAAGVRALAAARQAT